MVRTGPSQGVVRGTIRLLSRYNFHKDLSVDFPDFQKKYIIFNLDDRPISSPQVQNGKLPAPKCSVRDKDVREGGQPGPFPRNAKFLKKISKKNDQISYEKEQKILSHEILNCKKIAHTVSLACRVSTHMHSSRVANTSE